MARFQTLFLAFPLLSLVCTSPLISDEIAVISQTGEEYILEINPLAAFSEVLQQIKSELGSVEPEMMSQELDQEQFIINFSASKSANSAKARDYYHKVTASEKEDLSYIVKTLAKSSMPALLTKKSSLKKAGDRVDHIHPLRFILTIFSDPELQGYLHAIHDKKMVWKEFYSGLADSLTKEAGLSNLKEEYVVNLAGALKIDPNSISTLVSHRKWKEFVEVLIARIPREGNPDRYDM